jgi:hypothetical protein
LFGNGSHARSHTHRNLHRHLLIHETVSPIKNAAPLHPHFSLSSLLGMQGLQLCRRLLVPAIQFTLHSSAFLPTADSRGGPNMLKGGAQRILPEERECTAAPRKVKVILRVRPFLPHEIDRRSCVLVRGSAIEITNPRSASEIVKYS